MNSTTKTQLKQMIEADFSVYPSIVVLKRLKETLLEQFGPGGTDLNIIYLTEYSIDRFLVKINLDITYLPEKPTELARFNEELLAFSLCIGKTLSAVKSVLSTLSLEELIDYTAPRFDFTDLL